MNTISAINTAKLILTIITTKLNTTIEEFSPELTTRLKLLKLLYYVQGYHLGMFKKELFTEELQAWKHGPVVVEVYKWLKDKSDEELNKDLLSNEDIIDLNLHDQQLELITDVLKIYNKYSAYGLRDKTHKEEPWLLNYEQDQNNIISKQDLKTFFTPLVTK
ncbi:Panacea domain-containing protein [Campylobacter fetus]|uniref:Panacea domain-containing protein n=1 Tax=Campylobacter fetus TaxID=196 RepID=UPI000FCCD683|nr:type II toxin-antitoxin system antitoxin SocA domain-containing protein [Campylobacter fetus]